TGPGPGQACARQARGDQGARLGPREAAPDAPAWPQRLNGRTRRAGSAGSRLVRGFGRGRQGEPERGPFPWPAAGLDAAPVPLDDAFDCRKPDAVAAEAVGIMQPLERPEQLARVAGLEPGAVVADHERAQDLLPIP